MQLVVIMSCARKLKLFLKKKTTYCTEAGPCMLVLVVDTLRHSLEVPQHLLEKICPYKNDIQFHAYVYLRAIMLTQVLLSFTKLCCLCSLSACCGHICKGFAGFLAERLHFESTFLHVLSNTHARTEHLVLLRVTML